jgi:hypothetical protein
MSKLFSFGRNSSIDKTTKQDTRKKPKKTLRSMLINRTSHWNFAKLTRYFLMLSVILAIFTSYLWYTQLYITPERRFWAAINNSMATPSVVRTLTQGGSGNQLVQEYRFNFAPQRVVQNRVIYTEKSATTDTSVTTEGIVFPTEEFLRYTDFSNSRSDNGENADIDEVLGRWAVQVAEDEEEAKLNYLSEQISLVIFGNYRAEIRNQVVKEMQIRQTYGNDLSVALEDKIDGQKVYVYNINVKLRDYAEILNNAFVSAGYGEFTPLNPENYREDAIISGVIYVSKNNSSIVGVSFGGREERYSNYGVVKEVKKPEATLTVEELQTQVQQLLQPSL